MQYKRIKNLRIDADLTQAEVAEKLGLYKTTYQRYERGENEVPLYIAIALAKFYNVSIDYLAGLIPQPRSLDGSPYELSKNYKITNSGKIVNMERL